ncbi:hypothetical protein PLEOSDRAFT_1083263 [Pleurotus ostreatus PC15]|uniref:DNA damage-inducible protein 1 n=1 Tax=Pleurotus ostreatus (strain PC15) TaxID=1137138 RepID=A0A067NZP9_PLEO1|nr:hypothetical protein PLEOSDRAFT_1083263 [Pleurotus ostreatus PC15]
MELTFLTETGNTFTVEIDPNMEMQDVMALLEAESGIPIGEQSISYEDRDLHNPGATINQLGVRGPSATLLLRRRVVNSAGQTIEQDSEMMRLQLLGDPDLMGQLQQAQPELAQAAQSDPARFAELLRQTRDRQDNLEMERLREIETLNADPFDVEAQRKIEEAIRQQAVMENMQHALEYSPESFGRVHMLYIPVEVNGHPVTAFVDSGAQQTINLEKNVLRIQSREVKFLSEHELPDKARDFGSGEPSETSNQPSGSSAGSSFPGGGNTLGGAPAQNLGRPNAGHSRHSSSEYPEAHITMLMDLGATREVAISSLKAAGGNIDVAASLLF